MIQDSRLQEQGVHSLRSWLVMLYVLVAGFFRLPNNCVIELGTRVQI
jgi:hypothetical protein